jgi:putative endonuclease
MDWFLYILRSISKPGKIYIGSTNDLERRLNDHNNGNTRSTKYFVPWEIAYSEEYKTKKEARDRERQLKKWKNRERIEELIIKNTRS